MTPQENTMWSYRVRKLLEEGYGTEDIAFVKLKCRLQDVKNEVQILRESGELAIIYGGKND